MAHISAKKSVPVVFASAFKYPFNRPKGLLNILWVLIPVIGWFAYYGYVVTIVRSFLAGKFKETPMFDFSSNLRLGFFMFLKSLPFMVCYIIFSILLSMVPFGIVASIFISLFLLPVLTINFFKHATVESYFEFGKTAAVFDNIHDYLLVLLKSIGLGLVFLLMFLVLVGIPANSFTKHIFLADFYRRNVK